jgi:hypothetical protein
LSREEIQALAKDLDRSVKNLLTLLENLLEWSRSQQCWGFIGIQIVQSEGTVRNIQAIKDQLHSQFFMIAIILLCWTIWKARNEMIFNNNQFSIQDCKEFFFKELRLVSFRVKQSLSAPFDLWIQNL